MVIAIGSDHIVTNVKNEIKDYLEKMGHYVIDCGNYTKIRTHYAIYGHAVASLVALNQADLGIAICGTGVGISNSVNKTKKIRAVLTHNSIVAKKARELYNANVLCIGGRIAGMGTIIELIDAFVKTNYCKTNDSVIDEINALVKKENYELNIFDSIIKDWENGKYTDGETQEAIDLPQVIIK